MSLLNFVPCVLKMCSCANVLKCSRVNVPSVLTCQRGTCLACLVAPVPTCLACLRAQVLTCIECLRAWRVNLPFVPTYSLVNVPRELSRLPSNMPWVPCLTWLAWPRDLLSTSFASLVSSFDATFFIFTATVVEAYTILVRFDNLIFVPQYLEFIYNPSCWHVFFSLTRHRC